MPAAIITNVRLLSGKASHPAQILIKYINEGEENVVTADEETRPEDRVCFKDYMLGRAGRNVRFWP